MIEIPQQLVLWLFCFAMIGVPALSLVAYGLGLAKGQTLARMAWNLAHDDDPLTEPRKTAVDPEDDVQQTT